MDSSPLQCPLAQQMLNILQIGEFSPRYGNCRGPHTAKDVSYCFVHCGIGGIYQDSPTFPNNSWKLSNTRRYIFLLIFVHNFLLPRVYTIKYETLHFTQSLYYQIQDFTYFSSWYLFATFYYQEFILIVIIVPF